MQCGVSPKSIWAGDSTDSEGDLGTNLFKSIDGIRRDRKTTYKDTEFAVSVTRHHTVMQ